MKNRTRLALNERMRCESRQRVLTVELRATEGDAVGGMLVLPFGLVLNDGVSLVIDDAAPWVFAVQAAASEPFAFSISLAGFTSAFAKVAELNGG